MAAAIILWQAGGATNPLVGFLPIIAIFAIFYFLLFLPNQKRKKEQQTMWANLKNGDRVVTNGGIRGTIISVKDEVVVLRVPPEQVKLELSRSAVAEKQAPPEEQK